MSQSCSERLFVLCVPSQSTSIAMCEITQAQCSQCSLSEGLAAG
jgi:hypothetical protein